MQGGIHMVLGLFVAMLTSSKGFKVGFLLGSIMPDADILLTCAMVLITRDEIWIETLHRTFSHSVFIVTLMGAGLWMLASREGSLIKRNFPEMSWQGFCTGLILGNFAHLVCDTLYMRGVALLWPFTYAEYGWPFFYYKDMNHFNLKLLTSIDILTDVLFYAPVLLVARQVGVDKVTYNRFMSVTRGIIISSACFIPLAFVDAIPIEVYMPLLYLPGLPCLLALIASPIVLRHALYAVRWEHVRQAWSQPMHVLGTTMA